MKKTLTMDEYFAGAGIMTIVKKLEKERDEYAEHLMKLLDDEKDTCVWDYIFEEDSPIKIWENLIREKEIKVTGFVHPKV